MLDQNYLALDRTIISTAIPRITNEFHSLDDVGWYGSSYLLTCCAFQLLYGKIYTLYAVKAVFLASIFLFELGSAVCGAAPTSTAFIIGRAISGVGAAGIFAGSVVCIVYAVPLEKRPKIQGLYGALFGLASIVGPLIGGAFTSNIPDRPTTRVPRTEKLSQLDIPGTLCLVPGIVCLVLALQWGGQSYAWNNGRIVALFTVMGILLLAFVGIQVFWTRTATIPPRIFKQRSIISGFWATLCVGSSQYIIVYFLPIWFQSIKGVSAVNSGIQLLPTMLSLVVGSLASGLTTPKIGYYTPFAISGSCIMSIGAGLLTMLQVHTVEAKCIGYQILYGFGMGLCFQQPNLAAQAVLPALDVPIGLAIVFFSQLLGAAVLVPVGENVLANQLLKRLSGIDGIDPSLITSTGATSLLDSVPAGLRDTVLDAYNESLRKVFQVGLILSCLSILGNATLEWVSVLKDKQASAAAASPGTSEHDKIEIDEEKIVGGGAK
ncbi:hypothetical protein ETB97_002362 [Aspergillus alliaceus]|uniref:Major facilitator superfamily (MFS) profile domain-containing protein n=1 Tax=Petromyces alliaceus TaxID=209559 RepID=A0A8H6A0Y8_PETAA|nr:hypothetical protein ETB97_002362 [Aspergillus burnettii]